MREGRHTALKPFGLERHPAVFDDGIGCDVRVRALGQLCRQQLRSPRCHRLSNAVSVLDHGIRVLCVENRHQSLPRRGGRGPFRGRRGLRIGGVRKGGLGENLRGGKESIGVRVCPRLSAGHRRTIADSSTLRTLPSGVRFALGGLASVLSLALKLSPNHVFVARSLDGGDDLLSGAATGKHGIEDSRGKAHSFQSPACR